MKLIGVERVNPLATFIGMSRKGCDCKPYVNLWLVLNNEIEFLCCGLSERKFSMKETSEIGVCKLDAHLSGFITFPAS